MNRQKGPKLLSGISCSILGDQDYLEAVDLLTETFCQDDPIESALQITPDEFRVMVELDLQALTRYELSLVARDAGSGRMVGAVVAMDALGQSADCRGRISQKFEPISEIARDFHARYRENRNIVPGSCLYLYMICVRSEVAGRGIGKALAEKTLRNAARKGYKSAFGIATNLASTSVFNSLGFRTVRTQDYQTYQYKDRYVFASITKHPGLALVERECIAEFAEEVFPAIRPG